jgi:hypothetical protein
MQNNFIKISCGILALCFFVSCASVNKFVPRRNRAFQERNFDASVWRAGDAQTRGEMADDLRWQKTASADYLRNKERQQVLELLGEPDRKTRGRCCGAGGTFDEEVWLYEIEVEDRDSKLASAHFQIYFTESGKIDELRIALWDDKNPDYFPRVG